GWTNDVTFYSDNLNTNFNALQLTLQQNSWKGLNYTVNYQWASAFADSTGYASWDPQAGHGRDSNVRLQQMTFYGTYDLPFGKGKPFGNSVNRATDMFIGGWQISTALNLAGGLPFTLNYNEASTNIPSSAPTYPSYAGGSKMQTNLTDFVSKDTGTGSRTYYTKQTNNLITDPGTGVFANPGLDTIGNVGRNTYFGPGFFNADLAIAKTVVIHENIA